MSLDGSMFSTKMLYLALQAALAYGQYSNHYLTRYPPNITRVKDSLPHQGLIQPWYLMKETPYTQFRFMSKKRPNHTLLTLTHSKERTLSLWMIHKRNSV